eukprot:m.250560 g.250560  ORF g.250560 m.250560 type:complete len:107 (+) comp26490_c0_seq85:3024-3344(+)
MWGAVARHTCSTLARKTTHVCSPSSGPQHLPSPTPVPNLFPPLRNYRNSWLTVMRYDGGAPEPATRLHELLFRTHFQPSSQPLKTQSQRAVAGWPNSAVSPLVRVF